MYSIEVEVVVVVEGNHDYLKVAEVAARLRIGRSTAYLHIQRGEIPAIRIGTSVRVPSRKLDAWLESRSRANGDVIEVSPNEFAVDPTASGSRNSSNRRQRARRAESQSTDTGYQSIDTEDLVKLTRVDLRRILPGRELPCLAPNLQRSGTCDDD
jgi:excisionase family DNA binding protein